MLKYAKLIDDTKGDNTKMLLPGGATIPKLGQGTWHMAEDPAKRKDELAALKLGIDLGLTLIDTAEIYSAGESESLVGEAIEGLSARDLFIVSKVHPQNAGKKNIFQSCENSLRRLGLDALDLYLLHWRGTVPLSETVECMETLIRQGKIKRWGVSNLDKEDMEELFPIGGRNCAVNQVLYHLGSRGIEFDLIPWLDRNSIPFMAYCPIAQGGSLNRSLYANPSVQAVAQKHNATVAQILLAFVLSNPSSIAIAKAGRVAHVEQNRKVLDMRLDDDDMNTLNTAFPSPTGKVPLDIN